MREELKNSSGQKQPYNAPTLIEHGDLIDITLGEDLGENLDGAFTTSGPSAKGNKKPKKNRFS